MRVVSAYDVALSATVYVPCREVAILVDQGNGTVKINGNGFTVAATLAEIEAQVGRVGQHFTDSDDKETVIYAHTVTLVRQFSAELVTVSTTGGSMLTEAPLEDVLDALSLWHD